MGISIRDFRIGYDDIEHGWVNRPNSAGGVSLQCRIENDGTKTIKYVDLVFIPYNAVDDVVFCTIRNKPEGDLRMTGPLEAGKGKLCGWSNVWYNHSISKAKLKCVEIEYMDGSTEKLKGPEVPFSIKESGCYVATAVYGSYDCPPVWTLRRYRDNTLAKTWHGRAFIHAYYAISPTLVRWFGHTILFRRFWKNILDRMVNRLNLKGIPDTPYHDREW